MGTLYSHTGTAKLITEIEVGTVCYILHLHKDDFLKLYLYSKLRRTKKFNKLINFVSDTSSLQLSIHQIYVISNSQPNLLRISAQTKRNEKYTS